MIKLANILEHHIEPDFGQVQAELSHIQPDNVMHACAVCISLVLQNGKTSVQRLSPWSCT